MSVVVWPSLVPIQWQALADEGFANCRDLGCSDKTLDIFKLGAQVLFQPKSESSVPTITAVGLLRGLRKDKGESQLEACSLGEP